MSRPLYPRRDPLRVAWLIDAAKFIAGSVIIGAVCIASPAIVSTLTGGWG